MIELPVSKAELLAVAAELRQSQPKSLYPHVWTQIEAQVGRITKAPLLEPDPIRLPEVYAAETLRLSWPVSSAPAPEIFRRYPRAS
jgi:hypothetical protein